MKWTFLGKLTACPNYDFGATYLLVHRGQYDRVIYVGTTNNIGRRMAQHLEGYLTGNRSIWKVSKEEDIYALMTSWHIRDYVRYYKKLAENDLVWASTTLGRNGLGNLLAQDKFFTNTWRNFLETEFLPNIVIWAVKLDPYRARMAVLIESAVQQRLVQLFSLGRFFNHKDLSILGKIEFNKKLVRVKYLFDNVPELDEASKMIFGSLMEKAIPVEAFAIAEKQLAATIQQRISKKRDRADARQRVLDKYPKSGSIWEKVDLEKLRVMLVDFKMDPKEMSEFLGRKTSSINKKIERNDKLTARRWRNNIRALF